MNRITLALENDFEGKVIASFDLEEYSEQIRTEAIKEIQELMKQYVNYENVDIFIEALGQLEKQNKSKNLKF